MFENARTRIEVLEIMKDDLVSQALHSPMESRAVNGKAWAEMAGVIMRFSENPAYRHLLPPKGLTPRQRAVWIVSAFNKAVMSTAQQPALWIALGVAVSSYATDKNEVEVERRADLEIRRLLGGQ